jgi:hypothetical protein
MQLADSMLKHLAAGHPATYAYLKEVASESFSIVASLEEETFHVHGEDAFDDAAHHAYEGIIRAYSVDRHEPARDLLEQCFYMGLMLAMAAIAPTVDTEVDSFSMWEDGPVRFSH